MTRSALPYAVPYDLGGLSERGAEMRIVPTPAERADLANWLGIVALEGFEAHVRLSRRGDNRYAYEADFTADVVQACVVTLEPVPSHLSGAFQRTFQILPRTSRRRAATENDPAPASIEPGDDETELLPQPVVDLAAPALEELSLALDPYPRALGVVFEAPPEEKAPADNPFAVLEKLKEPQGKSGDAQGDKPGRAKTKARTKG